MPVAATISLAISNVAPSWIVLLAPVFAGQPHQIRGVIFEEPGRMARKTWIGMRKLEQLLNAGVDVHFTTYGKVENTPTALFIVTTLMGTQALDKGMLLAKLAAGARGKVLEGTPLNRGIAPLGYPFIGRDDTSGILINEDEAGTVRRIFAAYLAGDSLQTIASSSRLSGSRRPKTCVRGQVRRAPPSSRRASDRGCRRRSPTSSRTRSTKAALPTTAMPSGCRRTARSN